MPTNARIVVFGTGVTATLLDGTPLTADPELEPNTTYQVELEGWDDRATVEFTTGAGPTMVDAPPAPTISAHKARWEDHSDNSAVGDEIISDCLVLSTNTGCADAGSLELVQFDVDPAVGWLVVADGHREFDQYWPADCGQPVWSGYSQGGCFEVRALDEYGRLSEPTRTCVDPPWQHGTPDAEMTDVGPDTGLDDAADLSGTDEDRGDPDGCMSAAGQPSSWLLLMFALGFMRRRPS